MFTNKTFKKYQRTRVVGFSEAQCVVGVHPYPAECGVPLKLLGPWRDPATKGGEV